MKQTDKAVVSIIVPVYQTEKYLERCIRSIIGQEYENFELILIDDGSTDKCPVICDYWRQRDDRIIVKHQNNCGVASARNAGLDLASGDYIAWVDSDDWIEPSYIKKLVHLLECHNADMAIAASGVHKILREKAILREQLNARLGVLWNTLAKSSLYKDARFCDFAVCEDIVLLTQICAKCKAVIVDDVPGYHYEVRMGSAAHSFDYQTVSSRFAALDARNEYVRFRYPAFYKFVHYSTTLEACKVLRFIRNKIYDSDYESLRRQTVSVIREHVYHIPFWTLRGREFKEYFAAIKMAILGN